MSNSKFFIESKPNAKILEAIDQANRTADTSQGVSKTRLLLTTLSTTVMMALKEPVPKEYYQWTRAYLETIRNEDGTSLPNITQFLKYIDYTEKQQNIEDELQNTREVIPPEQQIEIVVEDVDEEIVPIPNNSMLSSTKLPQNSPSTENVNLKVPTTPVDDSVPDISADPDVN